MRKIQDGDTVIYKKGSKFIKAEAKYSNFSTVSHGTYVKQDDGTYILQYDCVIFEEFPEDHNCILTRLKLYDYEFERKGQSILFKLR